MDVGFIGGGPFLLLETKEPPFSLANSLTARDRKQSCGKGQDMPNFGVDDEDGFSA